MKNMFENVKFGDKFVTRDGRIFLFLGKVKSLFGRKYAYEGLIEGEDLMKYYNKNGKSLYCEYKGSAVNAFDIDFKQVNSKKDNCDDIISRYQEPIDEDNLDELADKNFNQYIKTATHTVGGYKDGFKAGYKKAKEK